MTPPRPHRAGIVLAGGRGTRMGGDKGSVAFRGSTLLGHVVAALALAVDELILVVRRGQVLPALPGIALKVHLAFDDVEDLGPVAGLAAGLAATRAPVAYLSSCDVPFLTPAFVRTMFKALGDAAVAMPEIGGRLHPLAGVYRTGAVLPAARALLAARRLRPVYLLETLPHVRVPEATLRAIDPTLRCLENLNTPDDVANAGG